MRTVLASLAIALGAVMAQAEVILDVHYLHVATPRPPTLSSRDTPPDDLGRAGAETALRENQTTGQFLGHTYRLTSHAVPLGADPLPVARAALGQSAYLILSAPAALQLQIADMPEAAGALIFNTSDGSTALRDRDCRANLLHTLPSTAMRTDALAQVLVAKRWTDLVMIAGVHPDDLAYATAIRQSLAKFGLKLRAEKEWSFNADMRRNASQEVPLFTQDMGDYDALILADEVHDFGRYVLYNTWRPRPVVGSEGLSALTWSPVIEQWGAAQLQARFEADHARPMTDEDYAAWAAMRTLGEAVTRTNSADRAVLRDYILSDAFELAGFKGRPLSYRTWNGQLRQPIALAHPRALVAQAPLEGFLHRVNEMDTLGIDEPESRCEAFE